MNKQQLKQYQKQIADAQLNVSELDTDELIHRAETLVDYLEGLIEEQQEKADNLEDNFPDKAAEVTEEVDSLTEWMETVQEFIDEVSDDCDLDQAGIQEAFEEVVASSPF